MTGKMLRIGLAGILVLMLFASIVDAQEYFSRESTLQYDQLRAQLASQQAEIDRLQFLIDRVFDESELSRSPLPLPDELTGSVSISLQPENAAGEESSSASASIRNEGSSVNAEQTEFEGERVPRNEALDLNTQKANFGSGLIIRSNDVSMKIGGYVKADVIHDFDPISNPFRFDTTTIEVGVPHRSNSTIHARQTRLNSDIRWDSEFGPVRGFIEGDFFGGGMTTGSTPEIRLRHAYGEVGHLIVGQTWSTFANIRTLPRTLDNEGSDSVVKRRQGLIRWTQPMFHEDFSLRIALEDGRANLEQPTATPQLTAFKESPDAHLSLRFEDEVRSFQVSSVFRELTLQAPMQQVEGTAWGINLSAAHQLGDWDEIYSQVMFGEGIGSYRSLPDIVTDGVANAELLQSFAWMVGFTHRWNEVLQTNIVYSSSSLENPVYAQTTDLDSTNYFAVNLIWTPTDKLFTGIEFLRGERINFDGQAATANRIQASFGFLLP